MKELICSVHKTHRILLSNFLGLLFVFFFSDGTAQQQFKFPHPVYNGDTLTVENSGKQLRLTTEADTFWIMKNSQYKNALVFAKKYKLNEELIVEYKNEVELLKESINEHKALNDTLKEDRDYYRKIWKESENSLTDCNTDFKKQKLLRNVALAGIPVAFIIGFLLAK